MTIFDAPRGVLYVAYGERARSEALESMRSIQRVSSLPAVYIADSRITGTPATSYIPWPDDDPGARMAKLNMDRVTPFDQTLYLDADTRVLADPAPAFAALDDGWPLALTVSTRQGTDAMGHIAAGERAVTLAAVGLDPEDNDARPLLALQGGVMAFSRCAATTRLFAAWRTEWQRFQQHDQAALLRALHAAPLPIWLLGRDFNAQHGGIVEHHFGAARRKGAPA